jgi:signal transduction histidine kinase
MFGMLKNTRSMNTNGIGLGLFICKKIVEQFEGEILCQSEFGKGTEFMFSFKLDQTAEREALNPPRKQ